MYLEPLYLKAKNSKIHRDIAEEVAIADRVLPRIEREMRLRTDQRGQLIDHKHQLNISHDRLPVASQRR